MTILCRTNMNNNSFKFVLIMFWIGQISLFVNCVVVDIQIIREFPSRVDFLVLEFVIVETDSLKMNDKIVWQFREQWPFCNFWVLLTETAHEVGNHFSLNIFLERLVVVFKSFDFQWDVVIMLFAFLDILTAGTNKLTAIHSSIYWLKNLFKRCTTQSSFNFIKQHVQELLSILLDRHINWVSIEVFKWETELLWIVLLPFSQF
jgi:hypothetical protein